MTNKKKAGRPKKIVSGDLSRWTIFIPWETRIAVTKAAERQNQNLNAWLDKALLNASREVLVGRQEIAKSEDEMEVLKNAQFDVYARHFAMLADTINHMNDKINNMARPWWKRLKGK